MTFCAIDFGTSNSAIAIAATEKNNQGARMRLVPLEGEHLTMPTAVFYCTDADDLPAGAVRGLTADDHLPRTFGRAAVQAYIDGYEGRLMRSMKSILGTPLVDQTTEVGHGHGVKYLEVITGYLRHLREVAQKTGGQPLESVVMGRPVFFVDDEPERDAAAQASLEAAARAVGFRDVSFQFEPIAAAFDYEQQTTKEETWHLINTVYQPQRAAELRNMGDFYGDATQHQRLMKVVNERLGHALVGRAEGAKIAVSQGGDTDIDLTLIEKGLHSPLSESQVRKALDADLSRIVACAQDTVKLAGLSASDISALYFTGGSTGLKLLTDQLEAAFPAAKAVRGDRLASVATGLGLHAGRLFGAAR